MAELHEERSRRALERALHGIASDVAVARAIAASSLAEERDHPRARLLAGWRPLATSAGELGAPRIPTRFAESADEGLARGGRFGRGRIVVDHEHFERRQQPRPHAAHHAHHAVREAMPPRDVRGRGLAPLVGRRCPLRPLQPAAERAAHVLLEQPVLRARASQRLHHRLQLRRLEDEIAPRIQRVDCQVGLASRRQESMAVECIGEDEPIETELLAQEPLHDLARERCRRTARIERGVDHVRHHHGRHPTVYRGTEGAHVLVGELLARRAHHWHFQPRIDPRATVPREVLRAG
jgi:hypothetical protein